MVTSETLDDWERRIMALDWHDVPKGFYALPINEVDEPYEPFGYKLYERKTPRTYRTGRTVGRDAWKRSLALPPGITWAVFDKLRMDVGLDSEFGRKSDIDDIVSDTEAAQSLFGQLTVRCGCCGRTLTDPNSKMRGIGPECAGLR